MNKKWIIGTAKVVGVSAGLAGAVTLGQEIAVASFSSNPYAQFAIMAIGFVVAYLKKPAAEVRK